MHQTQRAAVIASFLAFTISTILITIACCSDFWISAEVIDSRRFEHAGHANSGLFAGKRAINYGAGVIVTNFSVFAELQDGVSFFSRTVWILILFFESMSLIWCLVGVLTCVLSMSRLASDVSVAGPNGIYLWSLLSSVSHGGALSLFYSQFQSSIMTTMLIEEQLDVGFTTFNQARLSYAFYMSLSGLICLFIPPLSLVIFTESIVSRHRKHVTTFDPTLMLY